MSDSSSLSLKRSTDHLRSWLKVNQIKQELNDKILSDSIDSILQLFGSNADLLDFLIKYSSKNHLDAIHQILQEKTQKFKTKQVNTTKLSIKPNEASSNNFDIISTESIINICSFLSRKTIKRFKSSSRRISIICLQEMNKYSLRICIAKNLLHTKYTKIFEPNNCGLYHRYNINTTYSLIFEHLENSDGFKEIYQIPIAIDKNGKYHKINKYDTIHPKSTLLIFDKRDITILNSKNIIKMKENDTFNYDTDSLLMLFYFNIQKQEMEMVKYVITNYSVNISNLKEYIRNTLINQEYKQYKELKELLNISHLNNKQNLSIYAMRDFLLELRKNDKINSKSNKIIPLIFQIDNEHIDCFDVVKDAKFKYEVSELKQFAYDAIYYLNKSHSLKKVQIKYKSNDLNTLKQQITNYLKMQKSEQKLTEVIENIDKHLTDNKYSSMVGISLNVNALKHYLSMHIFNGIISAKNIEIYDDITERRLKSYKTIKSSISFHLVPYDTTDDAYYLTVYTINIYSEFQAPFPFNYKKVSEKPMLDITIKMEQHCTGNDIMKELIKISSNPLFSEQFEAIKDSLNNRNFYIVVNDYQYTEEYEMEYDHYGFEYDIDEFGHHDIYKAVKVLYQSTEEIKPQNRKKKNIKYLKLFMIPNEINNRSKKHELMIAFSWKDSFDGNYCIKEWGEKAENGLLGFPLYVWIDAQDTLQDILTNNRILQQYKDDVCSTYSVCKQSANIITKIERCTYQLYGDLLCKDSNGFIVIALFQKNDIYVDQHFSGLFKIVLAENNKTIC